VATRIPPGQAKKAAAATPGRGASGLAPGQAGRVPGNTAGIDAAMNARGVTAAQIRALDTAGLVPPGKSPVPVVEQVVHNLRGLGFNPSTQGQDVGAQLREALTQLQNRAGLPANGELDRGTLNELLKVGVLREPRHTTTDRPTKDRYEVARNRDFITEISNPRARAQKGEAKQKNFLSLLGGLLRGALGGRAGRAGGNAQAGQAAGAQPGADAAAAAKTASTVVPPPQAPIAQPRDAVPVKMAAQLSKADAPASKADAPLQKTDAPVIRRGIVSDRPVSRQDVQRPATPNQPRSVAEAQSRAGNEAATGRSTMSSQVQGPGTTQSPTTEQARAVSLTAQQDPTARGLPAGKGDPRAIQGQGQSIGEAAARYDLGMTHAGAIREAQGTDGDWHEAEEGATERDRGGSSSGQEHSQDGERGHAMMDDGSGDGEGFYQVQPLSQQIYEALATISRDPESANRATTYSWDVTLYHPEIRGAGQAAKPLFHLVVVSADPFDPVWERARAELARHLGRLEPDVPSPQQEDFTSALRRARVSDPPPPEAATPMESADE